MTRLAREQQALHLASMLALALLVNAAALTTWVQEGDLVATLFAAGVTAVIRRGEHASEPDDTAGWGRFQVRDDRIA